MEQHGLVHMAAEGQALARGVQTAHRLTSAQYVFPTAGIEGIGVHEQAVGALLVHRQPCQEVELFRLELGACPLDRRPRILAHARARALHHRGVMIAHHRHGALGDELAHPVHHPAGIGAIADIVAQKGVAAGALGAGMLQHGLEGLAVGMKIGDEGLFHGWCSMPAGADSKLSIG